MGTEIDYVNNFWGEKHHGYHVLYENVRKGEENIQEIAQFLKDRLGYEEESNKMLNKNSSKIGAFISHNSPLTSGWALTKGTLELLAEIHAAFVKSLQELSREVVRYQDDYNKSRKKLKEQEVIDAVNLMQTTTTCLQKSKETYMSRCHELEKLKRENNPNAKEMAKVEGKLLKAKEEYRQYCEKYENVRIEYELKMERACRLFQDHDEDHFQTLKKFLMTYAIQQSDTVSASMQVCSQFRESVNMLEVKDFINRFVKENATGKDRPLSALFEDLDGMSDDHHTERSVGTGSQPSSCSSSAKVMPQEAHKPVLTAHDLLTLDKLDSVENQWTNGEKKVEHSPTTSESSAAGPLKELPPTGLPPSFSASLGGSRQKLSMWLPKRKKNSSQSSLPDSNEDNVNGGFLKFRKGSKVKKSTTDIPGSADKEGCEDAQSTASSPKSDEKTLRGNGLSDPTHIDDEGFTVRREEQMEKEETRWSSCTSSEDEDDNEMQKSKIRSLTIRPADAAPTVNASVDELRDAIGSITLGRSTTFDKDPWATMSSTSRTPFSQSLGGGMMKPLRPSYTGDEHLRRKFSESEFARSNVPLNFSASLSAAPLGLARARPRSNTPTHSSNQTLSAQPHQVLLRKESNGSQEWCNNLTIDRSESNNSLGDSFANIANLSTSTMNLMQATISEQRVPIAMAINEYSHVWFKGADITKRHIRTFGTVMISFASSSLPLLIDVKTDLEQLQFRLIDTDNIKAVLPNKQLLLPTQTTDYRYTFDRLALANWLLAQQKEKSSSAFFNAEVLRYELKEDSCVEPPLQLTSYWKTENEHTDLRVDYRYNVESSLQSPLLNLCLNTKVNGGVEKITSDPQADWNEESSALSWSLTELSRHGQCSGSLKARLHLTSGPSTPSCTNVTFTSNDATISGASVSLESSDTYHLSMVRRKVISGKYFCEAEVRK